MTKFFVEIRNRLILIFITGLSMFFIIYYYKSYLLSLILLTNNVFSMEISDYFIFTSITEIFLVYLQLDFFFTTKIFYFIILYHVISFLSYGLYKIEYNYFKFIFFVSIFLGLFSILFCNIILIPILLNFFLSFKNYSLQNINFYFEAKIIDYFQFYFNTQTSSFFGFQCCVFLILFSNYLSNHIKFLKNFRKLLYLILLCFSTLVTPPDVFSQLFLFFNLLVGFEVLIFLNIFKKVSNKYYKHYGKQLKLIKILTVKIT